MKITKNAVVSFDYTLTDDAGKVIDSSTGGAPLDYLQGHGQIVPGLEREMEGKAVGAEFKVAVKPEDGYGKRHTERQIKVPRNELPADLEPEVGMQLAGEGQNGDPVPLWVIEVSDAHITLDGNHPLAGQNLHFAITIRGVREATKDELTHGHVHGPGGHH
jgi:FKBP-type peptidyl-prolyl cis-trans isomerase SlyD